MFVMWCYFSDFVIYLWLWFRVFLWFLSCYVHACDWEILNVLCLWLWFKRVFFNSLKLPPFTHLVVVHSKYCLFTFICTTTAPFSLFFGFIFEKTPAKTYRFATPTLKQYKKTFSNICLAIPILVFDLKKIGWGKK